MKITLYNPAPIGENLTRWGDYPFGRALQRALEGLGAQVTQRYWPEWTQDDEADVHLVLRGKRPFPGAHRRPAILWMVSHPSSASEAEYSAYDFVLLGSQRHLALMGARAHSGEFAVARQCTGFGAPEGAPSVLPGERSGVIFMANSRGVRRPVLDWALDLGVPVDLYGRQWSSFGLGGRVRAEHVENDELPALYRSSRLALNDHWTDMRYYGYINNRLFDCLAAGLPVLTDEFPELREVFGESLLYAHDRTTFLQSWQRYLDDYAAVQAGAEAWWRRIGSDYTFEARAHLIADIAERLCRTGMTRPQPSALPGTGQTELERLLADLDGAKILHVAPQARIDLAANGNERLDYTTAGPGCGPWTVEIDTEMSGLARGSFAAIVVDDTASWQLADAFDSERFLDAARGLLKPDGKLFVHSECSLLRAARPGWNSGSMERVSPSYFRCHVEREPEPAQHDASDAAAPEPAQQDASDAAAPAPARPSVARSTIVRPARPATAPALKTQAPKKTRRSRAPKFPDFVIAGFSKCGTTALSAALRQHPQITLPAHEVHFFSADRYWKRGLDWYRRHFSGDCSGDKTPSSVYFLYAMQRMAQTVPDVRLIFCVRNPVDRLYSWYQHKVLRRRLARSDDLPFAQFRRFSGVERYDPLATGAYASCMRNNVLPFFPLERCLFVVQEQMHRDTAGEVQRVQAFLGMPAQPVKTVRHNVSRYQSPMPEEVRAELVEYYRPHNAEFYELTGLSIPEWDR